MLGEGAVSDVGEIAPVWASPVGLATQAPIPEADVIASDGQIEVDGADPLLSTISTTRLKATCAQAPIGSI